MTRYRSILIVLAILAMSFPCAAAPLAVAVRADRLSIEGLVPGGSVALLGAAHEPAYYMRSIVTHRELLSDGDGDGKIVYAPPRGIAFRSIWMVVDLASGETTIATREGYHALEMVQFGAGKGRAVDVAGSVFDIGRDHVDILVVRPRKGAWAIALRGRGTEEGPRGRLRAHVSKLPPMRPDFGNAPPTLVPGDVVLMVDPERMEYWGRTITVGGGQ